MKTIEATVGYREEHSTETRYFCGSSGEGFIYKDTEAFKKKSGVCYIAEGTFDDENETDYLSSNSELIKESSYDYQKLIDAVKTEVSRQEIPVIPEFIEYFTECMLDELSWSYPETWLDNNDAEETYIEWLAKDTEKHIDADYIKERSSRPDDDQTFGVILCWMRDHYGISKGDAWYGAIRVLQDYGLENKKYNMFE